MPVVTMQREWGDCGIAALSMLLDRPYGDVSFVARAMFPQCHKNGLTLRAAERVAEALGARLRRVYRHKDYLVGATGMLGVLFKGEPRYLGHWVCIKSGVIVDPAGRGSVSSVEDYFAKRQARPVTMLVRD